METQTGERGPALGRRESLARTTIHVVWLTVGLALAVEVVLLLLAILLGQQADSRDFASQLAEKITWSVPVCVALTIGKLASRNSAPVTGLAGLVVAPVTFQVAGIVQQTLTRTLGGAVMGQIGLVVILTPAIKALEYGALGGCLAYLGRRQQGPTAHLLTGCGIGLIAGAAFLVLTLSTGATSSAANLIGMVIDEILTTAGCAAIVYVSAMLRNAESA